MHNLHYSHTDCSIVFSLIRLQACTHVSHDVVQISNEQHVVIRTGGRPDAHGCLKEQSLHNAAMHVAPSDVCAPVATGDAIVVTCWTEWKIGKDVIQCGLVEVLHCTEWYECFLPTILA